MILLLFILIAAAWAFYATLLWDRPDLATIVPAGDGPIVHIAFVVILLAAVLYFSWREIRTSSSFGIGIFLRNLVVISLGVALLVFTCHEVLHGVDPTGQRRLFG